MKKMALAGALVAGLIAGNMAFAQDGAHAATGTEKKAMNEHKAVAPKKGKEAKAAVAAAPAAPAATAAGATGSTGATGHTGH